MGKIIKPKTDLGVNSIMDPIMVPDGFGRVCDGLELRSGVARTWQLPSVYMPVADATINCVWEYRNLWFQSKLFRTYHGEYVNGQQIVYFTEEGSDHLPPQKVIDGIQVRLGTQRPVAQPVTTPYDDRFPAATQAAISGAGGITAASVSYRIAATMNGQILVPGSSILISLPQVAGVVTPSAVQLTWRKVLGANGYAIFGRTSGSERLLILLGDTGQWLDDGTVGEQSVTASSYDVQRSYQYVYTYYRDVSTVRDESGPSPLSATIGGKSTPLITRMPQYDGLYDQAGVAMYTMSTNNLTLTISSAYSHAIHYAMVNVSKTLTLYTSDSPHGLLAGDIGRLVIGGISYGDSDLTVTVPGFELQPPAVTLDPATPYPVGGSVTSGAHTYQFTAVRGAVDADIFMNNPAQSMATTIAVTVPGAGSNSVAFDIGSYIPGTDAILVYRDGVAIAFIPVNGPTAVATWTDIGAAWHISLAACVIPTSPDTIARSFYLNVNAPLLATDGITPVGGIFRESLVDIQLGGSPSPVFAPTGKPTDAMITASTTTLSPTGDVLLFTGLTALGILNGTVEVKSYNSTTHVATLIKYVPQSYSGTVDTSAGTMQWNPRNGQYFGWRIYRVGDTPQFLLVADLPMNITSFVDLVSTDSLGIAIPTAYVENGLEVVFDWAPFQAERMVNHYGMRFAIVDDLVRWTPTNIPDAWPDVFYAAFPSKPVALAPFKTMLTVLCQDGMYGLAGNTPSTLSPVGPLSNLGCIAPFSVQASNYGVMWLSKTGICISQDGVSATCLTSDRVSGRYFYAPSSPTVVGSIHIGDDWWMPATQTTQFAESMSQEEINYVMQPVGEVTADLPVNAEMEDLRSFYWNDRYGLYATGTSQHARMGIITIDMHSRGLATGYGMTMSASGLSYSSTGLPITTIPIKPVDVHVSLGGDCYMLLRKHT